MGDQPVTRAEIDALTAAITALTARVDNLTTIVNPRRNGREEHNRQPRVEANLAGNSSGTEEEES